MRHMYQMKEQPQLNVVYVWLTSEKPTIKENDCMWNCATQTTMTVRGKYIKYTYICIVFVCIIVVTYVIFLLQHQQNMAGEGRMDSYMSSGKMQKMQKNQGHR